MPDTTATIRLCTIDGRRPLDDHRAHVCLPCENQMRAHLDYLADTLPMLRAIYQTEPTRTGELDLGAMDLLLTAHPYNTGDPDDQIGHTPISTVLGRHLEDWGLRTGDDLRAGEAIALIRQQLRRACTYNADVDQLAASLRQLYAQTRTALHRDWRPTRYAAPCPYDGGHLTRPAGADTIECSDCPRLWDEDEYVPLAISSAPDDALLYAHEIATALAVPADRIRKLAHRGRLPQADVDHGRPMYELGVARQVLHQVDLWRTNTGEVLAWRGPRDAALASWWETGTYPAGTLIEVAGCQLSIRRGKTITIGPLATGDRLTVIESETATPELVAA